MISIRSVAHAYGYQIRYSLKSNMKSARNIFVRSRSKVISGLKKGKTYYIQTRAYRLDSAGQKVYGAWSSKVKVKIKK